MLLEISHQFYNDYGWTNIFFQNDQNILLIQDYRSLSINRRTFLLNFQTFISGFKILSENTLSLRSSENSIALIKKMWKVELGVDLRIIRGNIKRNNSGIFFRSDFLSAEFRPLLKNVRFYPKLSLFKFHQKLEILPRFEYFQYSLPYYSELGYKMGTNTSISFGEKIGYKITFNLSSSKYQTSPTKSKQEKGVRFEGFAILDLPMFSHTFNLSRSINLILFSVLGTQKWEDDISFFYSTRAKFFSLNFKIRRYLGIYDPQSSALREILSVGEVRLGNIRSYIGKQTEDYVYLSPLMSSESKRIIKYSLGFENFRGNLLLKGEIVSLYTFYTFKVTENTLNRYFEMQAKYKSKVEGSIRLRFSDFGWIFHDTYYRVGRRNDVYSSGWVPLINFFSSSIGATFSIKPEGSGVGLGGRFKGGEIYAIKRIENGKKFWEFSLSYSTSL